jgi:hypothetical protein
MRIGLFIRREENAVAPKIKVVKNRWELLKLQFGAHL